MIPKFELNQEISRIVNSYDLIFTYDEQIEKLFGNLARLSSMELIN